MRRRDARRSERPSLRASSGPASSRPAFSRSADGLVVLVLLLTSLLIGWPVLTGGTLTYLDNPVHLAEVHSLAHEAESGWSPIAFCGFPLRDLHSPIFFGLLAALERWGIPPAPPYALLLLLGFVAPALALYAVARRRAGPWPCAILAYLFLVQRPAVAGIASAFGGMATFYLAAAATILLADRLSRPGRSWIDLAWIALLSGFIGLTHAFVAFGAAWLILIHAVFTVLRRRSGWLLWDGAALLLGGLAASVYWVPVLLARGSLDSFNWSLPYSQALALLFLPVELHDLLFEGQWISSRLLFTDLAPLLLIALAGLAGAVRSIRGGSSPVPAPVRRTTSTSRATTGEPESASSLPLYGALWAGLLLVLLGIAPQLEFPLLGPVSWRQVYFVRAGLALAALPILSVPFLQLSLGRARAMVLAGVATLCGVWWGGPLRDLVPSPNGTEMQEVRSLWSWLREHRNDSWGRVYLQDTFLAEPRTSSLAESHVLALTAHETGIHQLGAYYRLMPYRTSHWTKSDQGTLFGKPFPNQEGPDFLARNLLASNCTHLVVSVPDQARALLQTGEFELLWRSERFALLEVRGAASNWALPAEAGIRVKVVRYRPGEISLEVESERGGGTLLVSESHHSFWKLEAKTPGGTAAPHLRSNRLGLMTIENLPPGRSELRLRRRPPVYPLALSAIGALGIVAAFILGRRRSPRSLNLRLPPQIGSPASE